MFPATTEIYTCGHTLSLHDAFPVWTAGHGPETDALLARGTTFFADLTVTAEGSFGERARSLASRITGDLERVQRVLDAHELALQERDDLARRLPESQAGLARVDGEISTAAHANERSEEHTSEHQSLKRITSAVPRSAHQTQQHQPSPGI